MDEINYKTINNHNFLKITSDMLNFLCIKAGIKIMEYYGNLSHKNKSDGSPVTLADLEANKIITNGLKRGIKNIPIISEEGRKSCIENIYFLVDPLDGTKEFLAMNGEFTVNIALICNSIPILGSIYLPDKEILYWTDGKKSYCKFKEKKKIIKVSEFKKKYYKIEVSRSHMDVKTKKFLQFINPSDINKAGSSLKLCNISKGDSNLYPRFSNVYAWDIAAGHAILKKAGGEIFAINGAKLTYPKTKLIIKSFIAFSKKKLPTHIINNAQKI